VTGRIGRTAHQHEEVGVDTLEGKGAVITGGASGIGLATAKVLAGRGAKVVLADIEQTALDAAVDGLRASGAEAHGVVCDVRSLESVQAMADAAFDALGKVHIVFNNAGVAVGGPILAMTHDDWRWTIDVDLWGPIHGVEAFLPRLVEQGEGGHVLFTSSFAGLVPNKGLGPYCVAKYGVVALAEVLWREVREHGIGVSVLCPMRVATNIGHSERNRQPEYGEIAPTARVADQSEGNTELAGRVLDVDGVAELTVQAIEHNRLYILPHEESRESIRRRFARIDKTFEEQGMGAAPS
jgi:NAD(P)-dependent dehydrogenase (short-subunit alcohol dehydrogenase family)